MPELRVKSIIGALAALVLGEALCIGTAFIVATRIAISIPLLIVSILFGYLVINMLIYPKAKVFQLLKLSISSLTFFLTITAISYIIFFLLNLQKIEINSNLDISANPLYFAISFIFGILSSIILIKLEIIKKSVPINQINSMPTIVQEVPQEEEPVKPQYLVEETENSTISKKEVTAEIYQKPQTYKDTTYLNKTEIKEKIETQKNQEFLTSELESLPDIKIEEEINPDKNNLSLSSSSLYDERIFDNNDIPDNIRLSNNQKIHKTESKGIISSIGKLLINNRDIENIIETNELMQQIGCSSEDIDIVTMTSGIKIYEKFNKIMVEYTQVKDLTLSNDAGFTIASIINDGRRSETVGAIASGAFLVLKNYLARLEIYNLQKAFFEGEDIIYSLFKVDNFILFFISEKSFDPINYTLVKDVLDQNTISNQDLSIIKNIKGVIESAITDEEGMLIGSINSENPKKLASLSSAIFENLKVFITNIQPTKLYKITVFTNDKVLTIRKYNDKIAGFVTSPEGPVKLSDQIIEIEKLMK